MHDAEYRHTICAQYPCPHANSVIKPLIITKLQTEMQKERYD
jgi:hypothetical protein